MYYGTRRAKLKSWKTTIKHADIILKHIYKKVLLTGDLPFKDLRDNVVNYSARELELDCAFNDNKEYLGLSEINRSDYDMKNYYDFVKLRKEKRL